MFLKVVLYRNVAVHTFKHSKRYNRAKIKICYLPEYFPLIHVILVVVVVVDNCFNSLFGTNGLLSDIVIR